jgi:hypothetical protein
MNKPTEFISSQTDTRIQTAAAEYPACGDEGTASFAIDAVRKLTTSYDFY